MHIGQQTRADAAEIFDVFIDRRLQRRRDRADDAIADENPEHCSRQGRRDGRADHFDRLGDQGHGVDNAENGRDDPDGRRGVADPLQRVLHVHFFFDLGVEFFVDQRFDLVRIIGPEGQKPQIIAKEGQRRPVRRKVRKLREQVRIIRMLDMALQRQHAFGLGELEGLILEREQLKVVFFMVFPAAHGPQDRRDRHFDRVGVVPDQIGAGHDPKDNHQFRRVDEGLKYEDAVDRQGREDSDEDDGEANEHKHGAG